MPSFRTTALAGFLASFASLLNAQELPKPKCEHVLLVVWDGMRPDFIREDLTPNAWALVQRGTFFAKNHATYIATTHVNGSSIATGMKPHHHGIFANAEYRPEINLVKAVPTNNNFALRIGDAIEENKWLLVPTIAEQVRRAGGTTRIAGTKEIILIHDRAHDRGDAGPTLFEGRTYPKEYLTFLERTLGKWPDTPKENTEEEMKKPGALGMPNTARNRWTTNSLVQELWKDGIPKFTTLWLGDPDQSQHLTRPGSPTALGAIRDSDRHLGLALDQLKLRGILDKTNVFIVSDHGFSTIERGVPLVKDMGPYGREKAKVKFNAVTEFKRTPQRGDVLLVTAGGSTSIYVIEHDKAVIAEVVDYLQNSDFAGPIFTKEGLPGTFKFSDAWLDAPHAPDIMFSWTWNDGKNEHGVQGLITADTNKAGWGTHGTLSEFCIHNTLLGAGPDIRKGFRNELPSGNVDVAPTILHLLGVKPEIATDGRILVEALEGSNVTLPAPETKRMEVSRDLPNGKKWSQWLQFTTLGERTYLDKGNSSSAK